MKTLERIPLFTALAALAYACSADHGPVGPVPPPPFRVVSLVKITPATLDTLFFRDTVRLTAVALDQRGSPIADAAIRWSSSSEAGWFFKDGGLSPTATGSSVLVYPYLDGSSVIQASVGATFATLVLNARQKLARITIEPDSISVDVNSSADFNVAGVDARNSRYDGPAQLTLASSDSAVALPVLMEFCDAGPPCANYWVVEGRQSGKAVLTASLTTVDGTFVATSRVTVNAVP